MKTLLSPRVSVTLVVAGLLLYPLVGIGHWGPAFYGIEALWMLPMPATKGSLLILSAVIAAGLALAIFRFAAPR